MKYTSEDCLRMVKDIRNNNKEVFKCEIQLDKWIKLNEDDMTNHAKKSTKKTTEEEIKNKVEKRNRKEKNH